MFESTAHQSLFKAKSCTTRFGIIFTRKAKTIYMSINILLKFILSTSVQCSTTEGFQFNLWPLQTSLLPLRAMVSCISRTRDFWLKISAKRCGLYTSFYGIHMWFILNCPTPKMNDIDFKTMLSHFDLNGHTLGCHPQSQKLEPPFTAL